LTALYAGSHHKRPPVVVLGHQFMAHHPDFVRLEGRGLQQAGLKSYVKFVGQSSTRVALSFYPAPDLPKKSLFVCPPLMRRQLFEVPSDPNGKFVLIYLLNHGYAEQIIRWHEANPEIELHCFYDKPGAPPEQSHDATLTFHRLDGEKFLRMMAACRWLVCTAGFESLCEAAYLGKPLFMVPVENHIEQQLNALDAVKAGFGITDSTFKLDRLKELPDRLDNQKFRDWVDRSQRILIGILEKVAASAA
jgi:uncharacterized protein (TIGR00661 family)